MKISSKLSNNKKIEPISFIYSFIKDNKIVHLKLKIHNGELDYVQEDLKNQNQIERQLSNPNENIIKQFIHNGEQDNIGEDLNNQNNVRRQFTNPNPNENQIKQFTFIEIKNVSKKKDLQKMYNQHKFQNRLLESFSHELRTPLNGSISLIQSLLQEATLKNYEQLLQQVFGCNLLLLHQINDILDSAAIENNNFKYNFNTFSMQEVVSEIKQIYSEPMKIKQLTFLIIMDVQINLFIKSDKSRILQILVNLLNNSIKFTSQGGIIKLMIELVEEQLAKFFKITVIDNGVGISFQKLQKLNRMVSFSAYSKLKKQDNENFIGLGIGMCAKISQGLRNSNESNLKIESFIHGETSFRFLIQCQDTQQRLLQRIDSINVSQDWDISQSFNRPITIPRLSLCFNKPKYTQSNTVSADQQKNQCQCIQVLIVDDVPFNHIALKNLFKQLNLLVDQSFDGLQAINIVKQKLNEHCPAYSLILMDIEMPIMDGYESTINIKEILKRDNLCSYIMMCSAYDSQDNIEKAYKSGMDGCLKKPIRREMLLKLLIKIKLINEEQPLSPLN